MPSATVTERARVAPYDTETRCRRGAPMYWMVALLAEDGLQYVYRVYAPAEALRGDVFWAAFLCHDEGPHPRASDWFDSAVFWRLRTADRT